MLAVKAAPPAASRAITATAAMILLVLRCIVVVTSVWSPCWPADLSVITNRFASVDSGYLLKVIVHVANSLYP